MDIPLFFDYELFGFQRFNHPTQVGSYHCLSTLEAIASPFNEIDRGAVFLRSDR
ncbi:MAG: hypothetical protein LH702_25830 [Phormidesmis sp. CAN_BIN44]|nr:hypothetical protein [Phormidesmis sp. CAN_BIN44]